MFDNAIFNVNGSGSEMLLSIPSDTELTMREERWMPIAELFTEEPPVVTAFKVLDERRWEQFQQDVTESSLRFFNPELPEFSHAESWESLAAEYGILPFDQRWRIPAQLSQPAYQVCRQIRQNWQGLGVEGEPLVPVFAAPADPAWTQRVVLVVRYIDWPSLATYFQPELGHPERCNRMLSLLESRGLAPEGADGNSCAIVRKIP